MSMTQHDLRRPDPASILGSRATRGILWREWLQHGRVLMGLTSLWIAGMWVALVFSSPLWMLAFGVLYCAILPRDVMGKDAIEGSEEFSFALPPTRAEQFRIRLLFCGLPFVVMLLGGLAAIRLDLPQVFWSMVVESGFTESFAGSGPDSEVVWIYSATAPVAVFASVFALAALARGRGSGMLAWFVGIALPSLLAVGCVFLEAEWSAAREPTGYVGGPALLTFAIVALGLAHGMYSRKEGVSHPSPVGRSGAVTWVILAIVLLVIVGLSLMVVRTSYVDNTIRVEQQQAAIKAAELRAANDEQQTRTADEARAERLRFEALQDEERSDARSPDGTREGAPGNAVKPDEGGER